MSGIGQSITRPSGRALVVGNSACRGLAVGVLERLGYQATEAEDPYGAMAELCRRPLAYRTIILSLSSLYREELHLIDAVKRRFPHIEVWLTHTDGRAAALAEASRLGADGLLSEEGLHRFGTTAKEPDAPPAATATAIPAARPPASTSAPMESLEKPLKDGVLINAQAGEAVLTADELKALLEDEPGGTPGEGA